MNDTVLRFENVVVARGGRQILQGVSFDVKHGEYVSILGQNGAGKSTLLKCAVGIVRDWQGQIILKGRGLSEYSQRQIAGIVAYVPQNGLGVFPQTVDEFVMMGRFSRLGLFQRVGRADEEAVERALRLTRTEEFLPRQLSSLSGGERQRVVIAAALAQQPEVLFLDEVCHFLDPQHESEVQALLDRINVEEGVTILSVTHDLNRAAYHSSKVVALKAGKVVFDGAPRDFMQSDVLERIYDKRFVFTRHPEKDLQVVVPDSPQPEAL